MDVINKMKENSSLLGNVEIEAVVFAPPRYTDEEVIEVFLNYYANVYFRFHKYRVE